MAVATYVAAALNVIVAAVAWLLRGAGLRPASTVAPLTIPISRPAYAVYIAIALSGLTALGAEVVWTRLLSLLLGATVYTFSIILAVFLLVSIFSAYFMTNTV